MLTFHPMMEGLEKFAAEVMPLLGRATAAGTKTGAKAFVSTTMIRFRCFPTAPLSTTRRSYGRTARAWRCGWCPISSISTSSSAPARPTSATTSRRDYGNRVGVWRLMEVLEKNGVRGTVALNGEVGRYYPRIMEAAIGLQWEFMGHGLTNSSPCAGCRRSRRRPSSRRRGTSSKATARRCTAGSDPAWRKPTPRSICCARWREYVADWVNDDLPYRMSNGLYSIPYSLELNDMPLFNMPSIGIEEFYRRICETFDVLYDEGGGEAAG